MAGFAVLRVRTRALVFALLAGCSPDAVAPMARDVAHERGVPVTVLLAAAYAESRMTPRGGEDMAPGFIKLIRWRPTRDPRRAASLLAVPESEANSTRRDNLRSGAALLAFAAQNVQLPRDAPPSAWGPALEHFDGTNDPIASALYAENVMTILSRGFRIRDDGDNLVEVAGTGATVPSVLSGMQRPPEIVGSSFATYLPAATATHRPLAAQPRTIKHIVIHATQNSFSTIISFFRRPTTKVASHYLVRSFDGLTVQTVDERLVAFHDACFNDHSIGIEHEGFVEEGARWFSDEMYRASAKLVRDIAARHGIPLDREHILGHDETPDCSDHTDPGPAWDWDKFMSYVAKGS